MSYTESAASGSTGLPDDAKMKLVDIVKNQLAEVLRDAKVIQYHTKRTRLGPPSHGATTTSSQQMEGGVDNSSSTNNNSSSNINEGADHSNMQKRIRVDQNSIFARRLLEAQDINLALQWRGCDKMFISGVGTPFASGFGGTSSGSININTNNDNGEDDDDIIDTPLHNRDPRRRVVDLRSYLASENTIQPPGEIGLKLHWLAVNGVQPTIPDNPTRDGLEQQDTTTKSTTSLAHEALALIDETGDGSIESEAAIQAKKLLPYLLSEELRLYFLRVTMTLEAVKRSGMTPLAFASTDKWGGIDFQASSMIGNHMDEEGEGKDNETKDNRPNTEKRKTLQRQIDAIMFHIGIDSGLQELLPFLIQFVVKQLYRNIGPSESCKPGVIWYCRTIVRFVFRMLTNQHLHLELHLHHLMPVLLSCVVFKRAASISHISPNAENYMSDSLSLADSHWLLRREAAETVLLICDLFGDQYPTLKPRVLKTFCEAGLDISKPLPTVYGGMVGLTLFGPKAIDSFLMPVAADFWNAWNDELSNKHKTKSQAGAMQRDFDIRQCQTVLLAAIYDYINSDEILLDVESVLLQEPFKETFEEDLVPMTADFSSFAASFI